MKDAVMEHKQQEASGPVLTEESKAELAKLIKTLFKKRFIF